jgi:hypothetical protein
MRTVEDEAGRRYLLEKRSSEASRVRDVETGAVRHVPNERLSTVEGISPLEAAAESVESPIRTLITATPDAAALGLLLDLSRRGPLSVRRMLEEYDLCESDLHGRLSEYRAAGLVDETEVAGERGYNLTEAGVAAVEAVQSAGIDG